MNAFQVSAKAALSKMQESRKVYTSKANEFVKAFTAIENELSGDVYKRIQDIRDASASEYAKEAKEEEIKQQLKLQMEQERIRLLADAEGQVRNGYASILKQDKEDLLNAFHTCDENTIDGVEEMLKEMDAIFKIERWEGIPVVIKSSILDQKNVDNIIFNSKLGKFDAVCDHYSKEINGYAKYLLSMIPKRRLEIQEGKESELAAEMKRKQDQIDEDHRAKMDAKKAEEEAERLKEAQLQAQIEIERKKAESSSRPIQSYSIEVMDRDGWAEIFKLYFGLNTDMGAEDLGKVKLDSMKGWCEKYAKSKGVFIESESIKYEPKYKVVARKVTK